MKINMQRESETDLELRAVLLIADGQDERFRNEDNEQNEHEKTTSSGSNGFSQLSTFKGIIYCFFSSIFLSLCFVIVKLLPELNPGEMAVFRFTGIFVINIPLVTYNYKNPFGPRELLPYLILRGIAGSTSSFLRFYAMHYLPIAEASVLIFTAPMFVSIAAFLFLKESCGLIQTIAVLLTMFGICLTVRLPLLLFNSGQRFAQNVSVIAFNFEEPRIHKFFSDYFTSDKVKGIIAALSSNIFDATLFVFTRKAKEAHHSVILFNFGWIAIIETSILTSLLFDFSIPTTEIEWMLIISLGLFSFAGQILLIKSLQVENAGPVSVVRSATDIGLSLIWQVLLFGELLDVYSITGAFLVIFCVTLVGIRKWVLSLPENSAKRRNLNFFTL